MHTTLIKKSNPRQQFTMPARRKTKNLIINPNTKRTVILHYVNTPRGAGGALNGLVRGRRSVRHRGRAGPRRPPPPAARPTARAATSPARTLTVLHVLSHHKLVWILLLGCELVAFAIFLWNALWVCVLLGVVEIYDYMRI